ncbi:MAG: hypothetical protein COA79_24220 [Planctomycetota bacterium]|nr:MAG: hypothetical protein COA79_24220 [Planctomycetota bacterium]
MNRIQFSSVREDPAIEWEIIKKYNCKKILLIGSGGCTGFFLKHQNPKLSITLLDPNSSQIDLIKNKIKVLHQYSIEDIHSEFDVGACQEKLMSNGIFEAFFKTFRNFIYAYILDYDHCMDLFQQSRSNQVITEQLLASPYWPIAFKSIFNDELLNEMFTSSATQFSKPGSYPKYFQEQIEAMFLNFDISNNYFLHHIFLGHYLKTALPLYLQKKQSKIEFDFINLFIEEVDPSVIATYDLIHLSNIFDWMPEDKATQLAEFLTINMKNDACINIRQLNNNRDLKKQHFKKFHFDESLETTLLQNDRSGFYNKLNIGQKIGN